MTLEDKSNISVLAEIGNLLEKISFTDKFYDVAISISEIIVKGKPVNYMFKPDPELPVYWGENSDNLWLDVLQESLLKRSGLIETYEHHPHGRSIKPTQRALELYQRLRQEERLDNRGYFDGKETSAC